MSGGTLNRLLNDFYPYAKEYFGFEKDADVYFVSDVDNANKPLGKTAYYDPSNHSISVYTDNRHPKDIMRSISHELVHHTQNLRGDLGMSEQAGQGYAQNDEHLREMEREAYEKGNLCFRDWEDGVKSNLEPGTIYEQRAHRSKKSMNNYKSLNENFKRSLKENWQDDPMGGLSAEDAEERMELVVDTIEDFVERGGTTIQAIQGMALSKLVSQVMQQPGVIQTGVDSDEVVELILKMQEEEGDWSGGREPEIEPHSDEGGLDEDIGDAYAVGDKVKDLRNDTVGTVVEPMAGGAVVELEDGTIVKLRDKFMEPAGEPAGAPVQEDEGDDVIQKALAIFPEAEVHEDGFGGYEILLSPESLEALESDPAVQGQVSDAFGDTWEMTEDGISVGDEMMQEVYNGFLWEQEIKKALAEYGDHETQARGGEVSSSHSSDPELDQIADIARTVIEQGGGLHDLKKPLEAEAFDVQATNSVLIVKTTSGDVGIASVNNVELAGDEELIDTPYGQLAVGRISRGMEEGFRDSPEEKEMTSKMSNKEFSDYHTRDKHLAPDLKGDMGPLPGMEGPFQFKSGAVLYYDNKAGKYYDRGKDMHLDNEEAAMLTMEIKNMKLKERLVASVMATLKEGNFAEYGAIDAEDGNPPSKIGQGDPAYMEAYNAVLVARGEEPLPIVQPDQKYLDALQSGGMKPSDHSYNKKGMQEMYDDDDPYADEDPYMASLEAEFPWLQDKKKGNAPMSPEEAAAAAAAKADADAAGAFAVPGEEEDEEDAPQVMREEDPELPPAVDAEVNAENATDPVEIIGSLVHQHGFMNIRDSLEQMGFKADFITSPIAMWMLEKDGKKYAALNKKYTEEADLIVGDIAIGAMDTGEPEWEPGGEGRGQGSSVEERNSDLDSYQKSRLFNKAAQNAAQEKTPMRLKTDDESFTETLRGRVLKRLEELSKGQEEMDLDDDGKIEPEDLAGLRSGKEDEDVGEEAEEDKKEESLRSRIYRIVQETLNEHDDEDDDKKEQEVEEGSKYKREFSAEEQAGDPSFDRKQTAEELEAIFPWLAGRELDAVAAQVLASKEGEGAEVGSSEEESEAAGYLKREGKQPPWLKKDKEDDDTGEEEEEKNEGKDKPESEEEEVEPKGKKDEPEELNEKEDEDDESDKDKEEVDEQIASNPEDFFRKLRNESRKVGNKDWDASHKSKRSAMLNERLMKSWFKK